VGVKSKALLKVLALVLGFSLGVKFINTQYKLAALKQQHQKQLLLIQQRHTALMFLLCHQKRGGK